MRYAQVTIGKTELMLLNGAIIHIYYYRVPSYIFAFLNNQGDFYV